MNEPNFTQVLSDLRAVQAQEDSAHRTIADRLKPLGWSMTARIGAGYDIDWSDRYDRPVAKVEAYPPMKRRDPATGKYVEARLVTASDAKAIAKLIVDCVNHHDALVEALLEAKGELKEGFAKSMVIAALERVGGNAGTSDQDLGMAVDYLGNGVVFA